MTASDIFEAGSLIAGGMGAVASFLGTGRRAEALEAQAGQIQNLSAREQAFIRAQAAIEAELIERQGQDDANVLAFNEAMAASNASWERQAGDIAVSQASRRWQAHVDAIAARFAMSGATLQGTTTDVILEQVAEMEEDLFLIGLNAERAALQQEQRGRLFSLQRRQVEARAARQKAARLHVGAIESEAAGTAAAGRAAAARRGAQNARITGMTELFDSASGLLSLGLKFAG
jgi:hypothetical protein